MGPARGLIVIAAISAAWTAPGAALARPEFAQKEKKLCAFCHVDPSGGGPRNRRGQYYDRNGHSLKGLPVQFKSLWKMEAPAEARRVALGDVMDLKKPQVLLLEATDELSVLDAGGETLKKLTSVKLGPRAGEFAVANLQKGKPEMIAVPGAIFAKSGDGLAQTKAPGLYGITGAVRFVDGEECVFSFDGMSEPAVFGVNLEAKNPLTLGQNMVLPDQGAGIYAWVVARIPSDAAVMFGWPSEVSKSPVIGLWDILGDNTLNAWAIWTDAKGSRLVFADPGTAMGGSNIKIAWSSENLTGKVLDAELGSDPKGGKNDGILLLMATGADGKGRTLEFFGLD